MADFSSPAYKRSRAAYVAQSTFEYFITLVVADAFLAKLLTSLGVSDAMAGIIASFVSLVFVVQIFSILLVKGRMGSRSLSMIFETLSQLCFASIYFIPFLPVSREAKHMIVILAILFAYVSKYLVYYILFKWGNSFVENSRRGRFSALREMVSLFGGIVFTLVVSRVFDSYEASGNLSGGFLFIAIVILVCTLSSLVSMLLMKPESTVEEQSDKKSLRDVMRNTLGNPHFRRLLVFAVLWECAKYFTVGFLGVYKTKELVMTVFLVQIVNVVANGFRLVFSVPFGKYSDKTSFAKGIKLGLILAAAAFLFCMLTTPKNWFFIILYTVLYNVSTAGTNQNGFNIMYSTVSNEYIVQAMAIRNCVGGIFGFGAALLGGRILSAVQANGNRAFGIPMYGQQLLAGISLLLTVSAIVYLHFAIVRPDEERRLVHMD
ncbi:MAG: MFS transporter [Clostridia bacterium]|nr:MFS transporter [Clostridia bacterium]